MVVTIGIGVVVALEGGNSPVHVAFHIDEGPAVHFAFPVLVEDDNHTELDVIGGLGDGAVVIAFLHGDGLDGSGLADGQRRTVYGAFLGRVAAIECVVDGGVISGASDAHRLLLIISACVGGEGRRGHHRCGRLDAFGLHEEVEVEIVVASLCTSHIGFCVWAKVVAVV